MAVFFITFIWVYPNRVNTHDVVPFPAHNRINRGDGRTDADFEPLALVVGRRS